MDKLRNIIITSIVAFIVLHTTVSHNHFSDYNPVSSIELNKSNNIFDILGLVLHHGSEKDLNEIEQVKLENNDLAAVEINTIPFVIPVIDITDDLPTSQYNTPEYTKTYKQFYTNSLPSRAPPKEII